MRGWLPAVGPAPSVMGKGLRPASLSCCPRLHPINTASQAPPTPVPSVTQGAVLSRPRPSDWPREPGMHLSGSVHFGVVNEMSCQTDWGVGVEVGGRQSERMNCSLQKLRVLPFLPTRAREARVRGHVPQHPHPHLCGPAARGPGEPDSRLPIFSFAAQGLLFVLYIYIHPQREPALGLARRQPSSRGEGGKR